MEHVDIQKNANHDFHVSSITDAFTAKLKEKFNYPVAQKGPWQKSVNCLPNTQNSERIIR